MTVHINSVPQELKKYKQWVLHRGKIPYQPNNQNAKANDPSTWVSYDEVINAYSNGGYDGIGFMFCDSDPFVGIDLDNCIDLVTGEIKQEALDIISLFNSYTEISPSGTGVHIFIKGKINGNRKRKDNIEMYDNYRYFTVTGNVFGDYKPIKARQGALDTLYNNTFSNPKVDANKDVTEAKNPNVDDRLSDDVIISLASNAKNGTKFKNLMEGITDGYKSQSEADQALACILAFYTRDLYQIERIMRNSKLNRDKWERTEYLQAYTIPNALSLVTEQYNPKNGNDLELPLNDPLALKERFLQSHGSNIRYCTSWGKWLIWNGQRWLIDHMEQINKKAEQTALSLWQDIPSEVDHERRDQLFKAYKYLSNPVNRKKLLEDARKDIAIMPDSLDVDPWLLNVQNGTINLRTGELLPYDKTNLITKLAPVKYDPDADAPIFKQFLLDIFDNNHSLITFVQKVIGYSLTGDTTEQSIFFMWGTGANGKSTLIDLIQDMLGDYSLQTPTSTLMVKRNEGVPNDLARLKGARLVSAIESERGQKLSEVLIKQLTGGDPVTARYLYGEWFEFKPEFKIIMATNHKPVITGTDYAIWRRIKLIPFEITFPDHKQDKELPTKLRKELSGILNWAIEGCLRWQQEGLNPPKIVEYATDGYKAEMDILAGFIEDCCETNPLAQVSKGELYEMYKDWCVVNGEVSISRRDFNGRILERGISEGRATGGIRVYKGIKLRKDDGLKTIKQIAASNQF